MSHFKYYQTAFFHFFFSIKNPIAIVCSTNQIIFWKTQMGFAVRWNNKKWMEKEMAKRRKGDKMLFYWHMNKFSCLQSVWRSLCDNQINLDIFIKLLTCTKNIIFIRTLLGRSYFRSQFNLGDEYEIEDFFVFRSWCRCTSTVSSVKCIAWICAWLPLYRFCSIWWSWGHDQPTESHKRNLMQMQKHKMPI